MMSPEINEIYRFEGIAVDPVAFQVTRAGQALPLEPRAVHVLVYLIRNRNRLVTKEEIFEKVWGETFVTDNALTRVIAQIRKATGDDARNPRIIDTVPTQGYRFIAKLSEADPAPAAPPMPSPVRHRAAMAAAVLGLVPAAWFWVTAREPKTLPPPASVQVTDNPGLDTSPSFSPDGNSIAYASDRDGSFEIYVRPIRSGGNEVRVTADGLANVQPAWSPDGQFIVYHSATLGGLRVVPALGGTARTLTAFGCQPAWSPDGKRIVFRSGGFQGLGLPDVSAPLGSVLWTVSLDGSDLRQLTKANQPPGGHGAPRWSPDGKRVLFIAGTPAPSMRSLAPWTVDADTLALHPVPLEQDRYAGAAWMPDSRSIVVAATGAEPRLLLVKLDGSRPVELVRGELAFPRDADVSRDGTIAFTMHTIHSALWRLPLNGKGEPAGEPEAIVRDTNFRNTLPAISPDGSRVAYHSIRKGVEGDIYVVGADGSGKRQLTSHPAPEVMPNWSADGKSVYFLSNRGEKKALVRIALDDATEHVLFEGKTGLRVARLQRDGNNVISHRVEDGRYGLWAGSLERRTERRLTPPDQSIGYGFLSRDGEAVAAERLEGESAQLVLVPVAGGEVRALTKTPGMHWPYSWSPDSGKIAFASLRGGVWNLWWAARDGSGERRLTSNNEMRTFLRYPEWSPRGTALVYERGETLGNIFLLDAHSSR